MQSSFSCTRQAKILFSGDAVAVAGGSIEVCCTAAFWITGPLPFLYCCQSSFIISCNASTGYGCHQLVLVFFGLTLCGCIMCTAIFESSKTFTRSGCKAHTNNPSMPTLISANLFLH